MTGMTLPDRPHGHLAIPAGAGPWPGVVVVHEAFGLNGDIRRQADRLAAAGYLAFAPDLYADGPRLRCVLRAFRELSAGRGRAFDAIEEVRRTLAARDDCTGRVGVIGFCMGGGFALLAAARYDFDVAAVNYGDLPRDPERVLAGACPIVASYGERDFILRGKAGRLDRALTAAGVPHDVEEYRDVGHSFLSDYRTGPALTALRRVVGLHHDPSVAADAWHRILAFFAEYLRGAQTAPAGDATAAGQATPGGDAAPGGPGAAGDEAAPGGRTVPGGGAGASGHDTSAGPAAGGLPGHATRDGDAADGGTASGV